MRRDDENDVTLVILAGGAGARMRRPKADLYINDCPILRYLLNRFTWRGPTMLVTAPGRENPPAATDFDRELVDPVAGGGPLRGLLTALEHAQTELIVVTTVDMPAISKHQLAWLIAIARGNPDFRGVLLRRAIGNSSHIEPFPSVFRQGATPTIRAHLSGTDRSVHRLTEFPGFVAREAPPTWDENTWLNLNTPSDVTLFLKQIERDSIDSQFPAQVAAEDQRAV